MVKIMSAYDGKKAELYCAVDTLEKAKSLLNFIKENCEIIIGEGKDGFYAKVSKKWSNPICYYIQS